MTASDDGHLVVVKTLIEAGANVSHMNKVGTRVGIHVYLLLP